MQRACDYCGQLYEAKTARSRFHHVNCRTAFHKNGGPAQPTSAPSPVPVSTKVADALTVELTNLGVIDTYEGAVAIGIAKQLDSGAVAGAAYSSLSKELDRRVDALRLRAVRPDDPVRALKNQVEETRLRLVDAGSA